MVIFSVPCLPFNNIIIITYPKEPEFTFDETFSTSTVSCLILHENELVAHTRYCNKTIWMFAGRIFKQYGFEWIRAFVFLNQSMITRKGASVQEKKQCQPNRYEFDIARKQRVPPICNALL